MTAIVAEIGKRELRAQFVGSAATRIRNTHANLQTVVGLALEELRHQLPANEMLTERLETVGRMASYLAQDVSLAENLLTSSDSRLAERASDIERRRIRRGKSIAKAAESITATERELQAALGWALKAVRELRLIVADECDGVPSGAAFEKFVACTDIMRRMERLGAHASRINRGVRRIQDISKWV